MTIIEQAKGLADKVLAQPATEHDIAVVAYAVVAEAESGKFTESEENDVIKFLSTFRQEYE